MVEMLFGHTLPFPTPIKYENEVGPTSPLAIIDGASGKDGIDVLTFPTVKQDPFSLAAGFVDDRVNDIGYNVISVLQLKV